MTPRVATVLDLRASPNRDRSISFNVTLSAAEEGAIMRGADCSQVNIPFVIEGMIAGVLGTLLDAGARGRIADAMIATGEMEVGRGTGL